MLSIFLRRSEWSASRQLSIRLLRHGHNYFFTIKGQLIIAERAAGRAACPPLICMLPLISGETLYF
jgi:hypothetical protein